MGGLDVRTERDPEYEETPQSAHASLRVGVSFETKRSASFGVETVKEVTLPHTLVQLTLNLTHIGLHPQPRLPQKSQTTPNLKPWGFAAQEIAGELV